MPFVKPCKNFATNSTLTNCVPKDLQPAKANQAKALTFLIYVGDKDTLSREPHRHTYLCSVEKDKKGG